MLKGETDEMRVFVTVGTTRFDDLVAKIWDQQVVQALVSKGYTEILVQTGNSTLPTLHQDSIAHYDYKPSLAEDISQADLVISHAGAGTCLEVLGAKKPLVVVVNDQLMDNHQLELAEKLAQDNHCQYCAPADLIRTIQDFNPQNLAPFPKGNLEAFKSFVENLF